MLAFLRALSVTGLLILLLVAGTEYLWRKKKYHDEFTRKFIHITVGTYAAFWPWFISWGNIQLLALGAFCALVLSRMFNVFPSMHLVRRYGTGEFLSTVSVGLLAVITHNNWLFAASILHLSLADGFAAVAGVKLGGKNTYNVFGQRKSLAGTLTFLVFSIAILVVYFSVSHAGGAWPTLLWLPFVAAALENAGVHGLDNLLVPLVVVTVLRLVS